MKPLRVLDPEKLTEDERRKLMEDNFWAALDEPSDGSWEQRKILCSCGYAGRADRHVCPLVN